MKLKKLPKKPKASASIAVKENWLKRAAEVKKENNRRMAAAKKSQALSARIAKVASAR